MNNKSVAYILTIFFALVLVALSYAMQLYQFTALEEVHIMLYDVDFISEKLSKPGGIALLIGSLTSQFFIHSFVGPLIAGLVYLIIMMAASTIILRLKRPLWLCSLASMPCLCLMLCLENSSYFWFGTIAVMLLYVALMIFVSISVLMSRQWLPVIAGLMSIAMYWICGSSAFVLALCLGCYCAKSSQWSMKGALFCILFLLLVDASVAYLSFIAGLIPTLREAFTPAMYYDMGSTYYMYIYAMVAMAITTLTVFYVKESTATCLKNTIICNLAIFGLVIAAGIYMFSMVHSLSNYENQQQRFYARHKMWDDMIKMPYRGENTPYMSYRFLALAQKGLLSENVNSYRPFISYIFKNQPLTKRRDQQVYSDIWYECDYMAAARKAAFDTDIVTPGKFNPVETCKLAEINIVYGDYAVAEKLLNMLDRTLFYSEWAKHQRRFLYNDEAVMADAKLGAKRRAIPEINEYLSPKGIQRDLKLVVDSNPGQLCAQQFYEAFLILTNQK